MLDKSKCKHKVRKLFINDIVLNLRGKERKSDAMKTDIHANILEHTYMETSDVCGFRTHYMVLDISAFESVHKHLCP